MKRRFQSALLGTALGDAWGYIHQEAPQLERTPLPEDLVISDDTQMTLALSTAMRYIDRRQLDVNDGMEEIATQFLAYFLDRDFDRHPGMSNTSALHRLNEMGAERWASVATRSGGSGGIMRVSASGLLAPAGAAVGWSVYQASLTHDSGLTRAAAAMLGCAFAAEVGSDLLDVASGMAGDPNFDDDALLSDDEKSEIIEDLHTSKIKNLRGADIPLNEMIGRVQEVRNVFSPILADGDFEALYRDHRKLQQIFGKAWDAGSCTASALLLTQLYLDHTDQFDPHDFLHVAVNWTGNRNTRASLTGLSLIHI